MSSGEGKGGGGSAVDEAKRKAQEAADTAKSIANEAKEDPKAAAKTAVRTRPMQAAMPFINGGLSGMFATTCIQPIDMIKVRLQLAGEGTRGGARPTPLSVTKEVIASGRVLDLYTGLSAGLLRQVTYTTARLGFFDTFIKTMTAAAEERQTTIGFRERAGAGLAAGGLAAMVGNPADLSLIRMQSDGLKPAEQRANYRGVFDALFRIARNEGVLALWAGCFPTVVRAMALNFGQLSFFDESKSQLKKMGVTGWSQTLSASAIAGFFASFFSLPFDFVKTRLQRQTKGADGKYPYNGMFDAFKKVARDEGLLRFYRGFGTYYIRIAPHAMITLIVLDYLKSLTT